MIYKNTNITFFIYLPYECTAVEEYLEQMAEKGWLLKSVKGPLFKFTKTKPKKIKYSVDVLDKVSIYDHKDTDIALEYRDYCQAAGWTYVCQTGKIQIFYTEEDKKIIPIHTDEGEKFKSVFKSSLYNVINQLFLILVFIFNIYNELFFGSTDFLLSSNFMIFTTVAMLFLVFINIINLISFFFWVIKARWKLKENKFMPYNSYKQLRIKNILFKAYSLIIIVTMLMLEIFNDSKNKEYNISIFIIVLIPIIISICVQIFINKKKYSKSTNMIISISSTVVLIFLSLMIIGTTIFWSISETHQSEVPNEKDGLTLMDFGYEENTDEDTHIDFDKSFLAQKIEYSYNSKYKDKDLSYTILQSQYPWIIKFHENRLLNRINKRNTDLKQENINLPNNVKVYSYKNKRCFIFISKEKIVEIRKNFSDISDDDFLNTLYNKLFNG